MTSKKILDLYHAYLKDVTQQQTEVAGMLTLAQVISETGVSIAEIHSQMPVFRMVPEDKVKLDKTKKSPGPT